MKATTKVLFVALGIYAIGFCFDVAHGQVVRAARENVAGGITAGGAHDVRGPYGGRSVGEGGVVTNGSGAGVSGQRGCRRGGYGARGCGAGATSWDRDGNVSHSQSGAARGAYGNTASTNGSWDRNSNGDVTGSRNSQAQIGNRTYDVNTTYQSGEGFDRNVTCSGSC